MNTNTFPSYIVFEGRDGCGKSTLSKAFASATEAHWSFEPDGSTEITKLLRTICLDKSYDQDLAPASREYLMLANRSISLKRIAEILSSGTPVVCDRSFVSGMVYAKVASGIDFLEWWQMANRAISIKPGLIVYLDVDKTKIAKRDGDIYDHAPDSFHARLKSTFDEALLFVQTMNIPVVSFKNDFSVPAEVNLTNLISKLTEHLEAK